MILLRKKILLWVLLISFLPGRSFAIAPGVAGVASIIPGLGQAAAGYPLEGLAWFGSIILLSSSKNIWANRVAFNLWEYNIYDAYRDAGAKDSSKETFLENEIAFLNPLNLIDPISVGIVGMGFYSASGSSNSIRQGPQNRLGGALFFSTVALGEEGLFRGFLFPGFSNLTGSYFTGAVISSAAFAAAHLGNKSSYYRSFGGLATIFTGGMLLCLQTYQQKWDLRHSIFTHAWFDIAVEYASISAPEEFSWKNSAPKLQFNLEF